MASPTELLERYNPRLVIFPHDPKLTRPGRVRLERGSRTWGDYHPCDLPFFIGLSCLDRRPPPSQYHYFGFFRRSEWTGKARTGIEEIRSRLAQAAPGASSEWELDLAEIPSQDEDAAWRAYGEITEKAGMPQPTVYGRCVPDAGGVILQYWYFYVYNDFGNNHEGDWEMAAVRLDEHDQPVRMGLSAHLSGTLRTWKDVRRDEEGHPVFYVARGSHAGYFEYAKGGYNAAARGVNFGMRPPPALTWTGPLLRFWPRVAANPLVQLLPMMALWRDHVPAYAAHDAGAPPEDIVTETLSPRLCLIPEQPSPEGDGWWRAFDGAWGSCHSRVVGRTGVDSPWCQHDKWNQPSRWMDTLDREGELKRAG